MQQPKAPETTLLRARGREKTPELPRATIIPTRRCIATGETHDVTKLLRFVVGPNDAIVPDVAGKLPGRGIWLTASRGALECAVEKRLFQRAAKRAVSVHSELAALVEELLAGRCLGLLGLTQRAGQLVTGFEKVRAFVDAGKAAVLIAARDGAAGGRAKLSARARALPVVALFDVAELSLALGRQNVVHAALGPGGLARRFLVEADRVAGFRGGDVNWNEPKAAGDETK